MSFDYLCFEAGGVKGLAYIGMLSKLEHLNYLSKFKGYAGSSIGAIFAMLLCIGYSSSEIYTTLSTLSFTDMIPKNNVLKDLYNIVTCYGILDSSIFEKKLVSIISKKINPTITLAELFKQTNKELVIVVTCLNKLKPVYLHHAQYGHVRLIDAVLASCLVPVFFKSRPFEFIQGSYNYFIDGSVTVHYPIWVFNDLAKLYSGDVDLIDKSVINPNILGLKLLDKNEYNNYEVLDTTITIDTVWEYYNTILNTIFIQNERMLVTQTYIKQTITVDTSDIKFLDVTNIRNIQDVLYKRGRKAVFQYFTTFKKNFGTIDIPKVVDIQTHETETKCMETKNIEMKMIKQKEFETKIRIKKLIEILTPKNNKSDAPYKQECVQIIKTILLDSSIDLDCIGDDLDYTQVDLVHF